VTVTDRPRIASMTTPPGGTSGASGAGEGRWRLPVLVLLSLLLVASLAFLGWALYERRDADEGAVRVRSTQTTGEQRERDAVMSVARQFVINTGTYGPEDLDDKGQMPGYRSRVEDLITTKFKASFEEQVPVAEQMVAKFALVRTAAVFSTGVATLDDDSASVLVAGAFTDKYGKAATGDPHQFRWEVRLVKVEGAWLVDLYDVIGSAKK
jgi:Mce-associated membrane protein